MTEIYHHREDSVSMSSSHNHPPGHVTPGMIPVPAHVPMPQPPPPSYPPRSYGHTPGGLSNSRSREGEPEGASPGVYLGNVSPRDDHLAVGHSELMSPSVKLVRKGTKTPGREGERSNFATPRSPGDRFRYETRGNTPSIRRVHNHSLNAELPSNRIARESYRKTPGRKIEKVRSMSLADVVPTRGVNEFDSDSSSSSSSITLTGEMVNRRINYRQSNYHTSGAPLGENYRTRGMSSGSEGSRDIIDERPSELNSNNTPVPFDSSRSIRSDERPSKLGKPSASPRGDRI